MKKIVINGGKMLNGTVKIESAKNSILPIMAATLLCEEDIIINNPSLLEDVHVLCKLLRNSGKNITFLNGNHSICISQNAKMNSNQLDSEFVNKMRASFLFMGPMLAKIGKCSISMPGGCKIGSRPIDLHLSGFEKMGVKIEYNNDYISATTDKLIGADINLKYPSVGATENIMMAASLAKGTTRIINAAKEPEICDLGNFLNNMGAKIKGLGTEIVIIDGVKKLSGIEFTPIPDRIEASTFIVAALITKGRICLENIRLNHIESVCNVLKKCGGIIYEKNNHIIVDGSNKLKPLNVKTGPYPEFPTDVQAQLMSLASMIEGKSSIIETVFENRFLHVSELRKMGADIQIDGNLAKINGVNELKGTKVNATDLRGGAAIILAGLAATGVTEVDDIYHIDRGYYRIEQKLSNLGADICRV